MKSNPGTYTYFIATEFIQIKKPWKITMELTQPIPKKNLDVYIYYYKQSRLKIKMERDYIVTSIISIFPNNPHGVSNQIMGHSMWHPSKLYHSGVGIL